MVHRDHPVRCIACLSCCRLAACVAAAELSSGGLDIDKFMEAVAAAFKVVVFSENEGIHQRLSLAGCCQSRRADSPLAPRVVTRRCSRQDNTERRTRWPVSVAGLVATSAHLQYRRWKLSDWQRGHNVFELWFGHPSVLHIVNMLLQPNRCSHCSVGIKL